MPKKVLMNRIEEMAERDNCDPNRPNASEEYALIEAYHYGHLDICHYLLDRVGVDPNVKDQDGDPFLFIMLMRDRPNDLMLKVINHPELDVLETDEQLIIVWVIYVLHEQSFILK